MVVGVALGLLGGGGSILTVPILIGLLGVPAKEAIATSLLVVGITSAAALWPHARAGRVAWRTGALFGAAGMVGAFAGGRLAALVPASWLLVGFAVMMLATAIAMLRAKPGAPTTPPRRELPLAKVLVEGSLVGLVTGLVGAGGGFLVVPALVLLGGMSMERAVGTSLVVIAMKSFAGLAGHLGHTPIDWALAFAASGAAVFGSVIGGRFVARVRSSALRRGFGWFVAAMAVVLLAREIPATGWASPAWRSLFVDRWPFWVGGLAIGGFALFMLLVDNKLLGVSTGCAELCRLRDPAVRRSWRPPFVLGIVAGGGLAAILARSGPTFDAGPLAGVAGPATLPLLFAGGALIGFGARAAGGCTSGHAIVGVAQGARASLAATAAFMVAGFAVTNLLFRVLT
jgi:hypothetical protein